MKIKTVLLLSIFSLSCYGETEFDFVKWRNECPEIGKITPKDFIEKFLRNPDFYQPGEKEREEERVKFAQNLHRILWKGKFEGKEMIFGEGSDTQSVKNYNRFFYALNEIKQNDKYIKEFIESTKKNHPNINEIDIENDDKTENIYYNEKTELFQGITDEDKALIQSLYQEVIKAENEQSLPGGIRLINQTIPINVEPEIPALESTNVARENLNKKTYSDGEKEESRKAIEDLVEKYREWFQHNKKESPKPEDIKNKIRSEWKEPLQEFLRTQLGYGNLEIKEIHPATTPSAKIVLGMFVQMKEGRHYFVKFSFDATDYNDTKKLMTIPEVKNNSMESGHGKPFRIANALVAFDIDRTLVRKNLRIGQGILGKSTPSHPHFYCEIQEAATGKGLVDWQRDRLKVYLEKRFPNRNEIFIKDLPSSVDEDWNRLEKEFIEAAEKVGRALAAFHAERGFEIIFDKKDLNKITSIKTQFQHGDCHPGNLFLDKDFATFIDIPSLAEGVDKKGEDRSEILFDLGQLFLLQYRHPHVSGSKLKFGDVVNKTAAYIKGKDPTNQYGLDLPQKIDIIYGKMTNNPRVERWFDIWIKPAYGAYAKHLAEITFHKLKDRKLDETAYEKSILTYICNNPVHSGNFVTNVCNFGAKSFPSLSKRFLGQLLSIAETGASKAFDPGKSTLHGFDVS